MSPFPTSSFGHLSKPTYTTNFSYFLIWPPVKAHIHHKLFLLPHLATCQSPHTPQTFPTSSFGHLSRPTYTTNFSYFLIWPPVKAHIHHKLFLLPHLATCQSPHTPQTFPTSSFGHLSRPTYTTNFSYFLIWPPVKAHIHHKLFLLPHLATCQGPHTPQTFRNLSFPPAHWSSG